MALPTEAVESQPAQQQSAQQPAHAPNPGQTPEPFGQPTMPGPPNASITRPPQLNPAQQALADQEQAGFQVAAPQVGVANQNPPGDEGPPIESDVRLLAQAIKSGRHASLGCTIRLLVQLGAQSLVNPAEYARYMKSPKEMAMQRIEVNSAQLSPFVERAAAAFRGE